MMAMRNIWVMIVGICLFGCGVGKQPPSSQLFLTWKLEKIVWKPDILRIHSA